MREVLRGNIWSNWWPNSSPKATTACGGRNTHIDCKALSPVPISDPGVATGDDSDLGRGRKELGCKWHVFSYARACLCVCIGLESLCATINAFHFRVTELHTHTAVYIFISRMAGARVWFNRWLAGYRCVWLKAVPGWAS